MAGSVAGLDGSLLALAARVGGASAAIAKLGRVCHKTGRVTMMEGAGAASTATAVELYVCDDVVLIARAEGRGMIIVAEVPLTSGVVAVRDKAFLQVAALSSPSVAAPPWSFELLSPGRVVTLVASDAVSKREWLGAFATALAEHAPADRQMEPGWKHTLVTGTLHAAAVSGNEPQLRDLVALTSSGRAVAATAAAAAASAGAGGGAADTAGFVPARITDDETSPRFPTLDIDEEDDEGRTPLLYAALIGHLGCIRVLLAAGASVSSTDRDLNTALHLAATRLDPDAVAALVANGAPLDVRNIVDATPLVACLHAYLRAAHPALASLRLKPLTADDATTLVIRAAKVCDLLLTHGADPRATDTGGWEPLHLAAATPLASVVASLVRWGAEPNAVAVIDTAASSGSAAAAADAVTSLHIACGAHHRALTISAAGAAASDLATPASGAPGPIFHPDTIGALLAHGCQPNARTLARGDTPLHVLFAAAAAAARGASAAPVDAGAAAAAATAVATSRAEAAAAAQRLVAAGARIDVANAAGTTVAAAADAAGVPRAALEAAAAHYASRGPPASASTMLYRIRRQAVGRTAFTVAGPCVAGKRAAAGRLALLTRVPSTAAKLAARVPEKEWPADSSIAACPLCNTGFSMFNRQHHCRHCGVLACSACSSKKFPLASPGAVDSDDDKAAGAADDRVCDGCFNRLCSAVESAARAAAAWAAEKERAVASVAASRGADKTALMAGATAAAARPAPTAAIRSPGGGAGASAGAGSAAATVGGQITGLQATLGEARDRLAERGEKLSRLEDRTAEMADSAVSFAAAAEKLRKQQASGGLGGWFG